MERLSCNVIKSIAKKCEFLKASSYAPGKRGWLGPFQLGAAEENSRSKTKMV